MPHVPFKIDGFDFMLTQEGGSSESLVITVLSKTPLADLPIETLKTYSLKTQTALDKVYDIMLEQRPVWTKPIDYSE